MSGVSGRLTVGTEESSTTPDQRGPDLRPRALVPHGWWFDALLLVGFAAITIALADSQAVRHLDVVIRDWSDGHRPFVANLLARVFNYLGQGTPLTLLALALAVIFGWRQRSIRPLLPVVVAFILTFFTIGPLKVATARAAPHYGPVELFASPDQLSYPSGHVGNSIVWYGVLALLLSSYLRPRLRTALRLVPPAVVCVVTTYLGFHWLTDTIAGLLIGLFLDRLMARVPWQRIPLPRRLDRRPATSET